MDAEHRAAASLPEGGDPACWLASVCERCGAFNEVQGVPCWRCGGTTTPTDAGEAAGSTGS